MCFKSKQEQTMIKIFTKMQKNKNRDKKHAKLRES